MPYRFSFAPFFAAAGILLLAGCATANLAGVAQTTHIEQVANRPIPWEITPPATTIWPSSRERVPPLESPA